jgi:hypothetical protein
MRPGSLPRVYREGMGPALPRVLGGVALAEALTLGWLTMSAWISLEALSDQGGGLGRSVATLVALSLLSALMVRAAGGLLIGASLARGRYLGHVAITNVLLLMAALGGALDWLLYGSSILVGAVALVPTMIVVVSLRARPSAVWQQPPLPG